MPTPELRADRRCHNSNRAVSPQSTAAVRARRMNAARVGVPILAEGGGVPSGQAATQATLEGLKGDDWRTSGDLQGFSAVLKTVRPRERSPGFESRPFRFREPNRQCSRRFRPLVRGRSALSLVRSRPLMGA
jgi:hypothetical protein